MKYYIIACAAMAALTGPPAFAGTIVQSEGVTLLDVGTSFAVPLPFNRFDPALGTLDSVTLDLTASFSGTVGVENTSASPDVVTGIIAGSVTVVTNSSSLTVEVFPSAPGPAHHFAAFDGSLDFAGASGATDAVAGLPIAGSVAAPPPASALPEFIGAGQIFLTLTATSFPIVTGLETETVEETADAHTTEVLTYRFTPLAVAEPAGWTILAAGLLGLWRRRNFP